MPILERTLPKVLLDTARRQVRANLARLLGRPPAPVRFVIFGQSRTGSTVLVDLLNSMPEICCEEEHYHPKNNLFLGRAWMLRYADGRSRLTSKRAYGFKFKIYQLEQHGLSLGDARAFLEELIADGWKVVYLKREDLLRQVLSIFIARARKGTYHLKGGSRNAVDALFPLHVDASALVEEMNRRADYLRHEAAALQGLSHLELEYGRDLESPEAQQATMRRFCEFLGVPAGEARSEHQKIAPRSLEQTVRNLDEVRQALAQTPHARFLR